MTYHLPPTTYHLSPTTHIGLIGLGTMGANLARNAARNGATVSVYNRTGEKTDEFMKRYGHEGKFIATTTIDEFLASLPEQKIIVLMVNAGKPVDEVIENLTCALTPSPSPEGRGEKDLLPNTYHLKPILIDAGNSHFTDSNRRENMLKEHGIHFLSMGVSGGEEGALLGPSMMPSGQEEAYNSVMPLLQKMAAKDGKKGKCVTYIGAGGSGHFVKMVHNGIEYGDMQLIAEAYHIMRSMLQMTNAEIGETFAKWNRTKELKSFLIEITAKICLQKDDITGDDLLDKIKDAAKQKGTGKWTTQSALDLGVAIPTITAAVDARGISSLFTLRQTLASHFSDLHLPPKSISLSALKDALFLAKICSYAQGYALIAEASREYGWNINLAEVSRIWRGGCIIRSHLLELFEDAFRSHNDLAHLFLSPSISSLFLKKHQKLRTVIARSVLTGIPLPAMSASLSYIDALRTAHLPQNLTQAQRDFFGAHTFERLDREGVFHAEW